MNTKPNIRSDSKKEPNDIRIGMQSRVRSVIRYCNNLISTSNPKFLKFSAVGGAIGKLVDVVEVLKLVNKDLYQTNKIATVSYQSIDDKKEVLNQRLYPKFEVILSFEEPKEKNPENFQDKLSEEEKKKKFELLNSRPQRTGGRGGRVFRGGNRRGGFRGRGRGGFRGNRRGGFRPRGGRGFRGGFRNQRRGGY